MTHDPPGSRGTAAAVQPLNALRREQLIAVWQVAEGADLDASVLRETEEEVGLKPADYDVGDGWTVVAINQVVACFRLLTSQLAAAALQQRIEAYLASEALPELSGVKLVRNVDDFDPAMPQFIKAFLEHALAEVR